MFGIVIDEENRPFIRVGVQGIGNYLLVCLVHTNVKHFKIHTRL